ncbi:MAG TPA: hypothetical protein VJT81_06705 [Burkholderiales bacterium]|nr:hypothetical protein [Burkholderiales bacterium]
MKRLDIGIELTASAFTLAGIYVGSTTAVGAGCYLVALVFWYVIMFRKALWGIAPLNVATTFVATFNLWRAL